MKKILYILIVLAFLAVPAMAAPNRSIQLTIVDEFGDPVTTITSITIFDVGTSSETTIYAQREKTNEMTNPVTTGSTNSTFQQSLGLVSWFQTKPTYKVTITDGSKTLTIDDQNEGDTRFPWYDNYIGTAASLSVGDNESITVGDDSDMVLAWNNGSDFMSWIPASDGSAFNLGTSGTGKNVDFNWFVGTALGIKGDEGAATLIIDGLTTSINTDSNFNTNINTGTSTGNVTIGGTASGTLALDTTAGVTINADDSVDITTTGGSADIDIDAIAGSVIIDGGETATDAVLISATAGGGGVTVTSGTGDITLDSGDDIFLAADTSSGDVISIINTQGTAASSIIIRTVAAGSIDIDSGEDVIVDVTDDILLTSGDDTVITTTGALTIVNTEAMTVSGALTISGVTTFAGGQTRTVVPIVTVDGSVPPSTTAVGTSGQSQISVWSFDANPNATGDDYVFLGWQVPVGYVVDSANLFFNFSYSNAETDGDDVVFDITVLAIAPGTGAAGGDVFDGAGTAVSALDVDLVNGDGDEGKVMQGTFDIEVLTIAAGDYVVIAFWVDEDQCDLATSGTVDIHNWFITYESTE